MMLGDVFSFDQVGPLFFGGIVVLILLCIILGHWIGGKMSQGFGTKGNMIMTQVQDMRVQPTTQDEFVDLAGLALSVSFEGAIDA